MEIRIRIYENHKYITILYILKASKELSNAIKKGCRNPSKAVRGDLEGFTKILLFLCSHEVHLYSKEF